MGRRKKDAPDLYPDRSSGQWAINLDGVKHRLGRDRAEAERKRRRLLAQRLGGEPTSPVQPKPGAVLTVDAALTRYAAHVVGRKDSRQVARVRAAIDAASALYGSLPVGEFDQDCLEHVRSHLLAQPSKRKPSEHLSRNYVNSLIGCLQTAWVWLVGRKLAPVGSDAALRSVRPLGEGDGGREVPRIAAVDPATVARTLTGGKLNHVCAAMVWLQQLTGMRPGEVVGMRRRDLSCDPAEKLVVPGTKPVLRVGAVWVGPTLVWVYVPESHKTLRKGKARIITLGPRAQAVLSLFLEGRRPDDYLFSPQEAVAAWRCRQRAARRSTVPPSQQDRAKPLPRRAPGKRYSVRSYAEAVERATLKAQVEHWAPNMLRHHVATLSDDTADRDTTAALLGHSTPDMAAIYAERAVQRAAAFVAANG